MFRIVFICENIYMLCDFFHKIGLKLLAKINDLLKSLVTHIDSIYD